MIVPSIKTKLNNLPYDLLPNDYGGCANALTYFHVFPYSRRRGTTAAKLPGQVAPEVIRGRARRLRQLGERKRMEFARGFVGTSLPVLAERASVERNSPLVGYSRNYQRVEFAGAPELANREVNVEIEAVRGGRLVGHLAGALDHGQR